jgi:hypothetical protein
MWVAVVYGNGRQPGSLDHREALARHHVAAGSGRVHVRARPSEFMMLKETRPVPPMVRSLPSTSRPLRLHTATARVFRGMLAKLVTHDSFGGDERLLDAFSIAPLLTPVHTATAVGGFTPGSSIFPVA